jgi:hypothetical protein
MEAIGDITHKINQQLQNESRDANITGPTPEQRRAIGEVLDRWRLNLGWTPLDDDSHAMMCQAFIRILDKEKIPHTAYGELFERSLRTRAVMLAAGKKVPEFGAELMVAEWLGEAGLRRELGERRKIGADKQLVCESYTPKCSWCLDEGKILFGLRKGERCPHRD